MLFLVLFISKPLTPGFLQADCSMPTGRTGRGVGLSYFDYRLTCGFLPMKNLPDLGNRQYDKATAIKCAQKLKLQTTTYLSRRGNSRMKFPM